MKSGEISEIQRNLQWPASSNKSNCPSRIPGVPRMSTNDPQAGIPGKSPACPQGVHWEFLGGPRALRSKHVEYPNTFICPREHGDTRDISNVN